MNPWAILGVNRKSTDEEIRAAFIALAKKYHPDRKNGSVDKFNTVSEAYQMLKNKKARIQTIEVTFMAGYPCFDCKGKGVFPRKRSSIYEKTTYDSCRGCGGSGFNTLKDGSDVIKL